jgi:hypothetical protein
VTQIDPKSSPVSSDIITDLLLASVRSSPERFPATWFPFEMGTVQNGARSIVMESSREKVPSILTACNANSD